MSLAFSLRLSWPILFCLDLKLVLCFVLGYAPVTLLRLIPGSSPVLSHSLHLWFDMNAILSEEMSILECRLHTAALVSTWCKSLV